MATFCNGISVWHIEIMFLYGNVKKMLITSISLEDELRRWKEVKGNPDISVVLGRAWWSVQY